MNRLVVVDLIPALLSWEGRDDSMEPDVATGAEPALEHLFAHYRLAAIADAGVSGAGLRATLEREGLVGFFETVGTSADFGPAVSPRVLRRLASTVGVTSHHLVLVTAREHLVSPMAAARIPVVHTSHGEFERVADAVIELVEGRITP